MNTYSVALYYEKYTFFKTQMRLDHMIIEECKNKEEALGYAISNSEFKDTYNLIMWSVRTVKELDNETKDNE